MEWLNEPASWQRTGDVLTVSVDPGTDFWRETGYGYIRDSGHVYGEVLAGDLDVSVRIRCVLEAQYDQVGVMVRADEQTWLKTGIEFFEGRPRLSTVLTLGRSSWMVTDLPNGADDILLRVSRRGDAVEVRYQLGDGPAELAALVFMPPDADVLAGVMAAAPEGPGFRVTFTDLQITAADWPESAEDWASEPAWTGEERSAEVWSGADAGSTTEPTPAWDGPEAAPAWESPEPAPAWEAPESAPAWESQDPASVWDSGRGEGSQQQSEPREREQLESEPRDSKPRESERPVWASGAISEDHPSWPAGDPAVPFPGEDDPDWPKKLGLADDPDWFTSAAGDDPAGPAGDAARQDGPADAPATDAPHDAAGTGAPGDALGTAAPPDVPGTDDPLGGASRDDPLGGASRTGPLGGASRADPLGGASRDDPLGGASRDDPLGGASRDDPLGGASRDDPLGGASGTDVLGDAPTGPESAVPGEDTDSKPTDSKRADGEPDSNRQVWAPAPVPEDAVADWDRLAAGVQRGTRRPERWTAQTDADVANEWPGPPLPAARRASIGRGLTARDEPGPPASVAGPSQSPAEPAAPETGPDGEPPGDKTGSGPAGDGPKEPAHAKRRKSAAARPPVDVPSPPDPADEWISLLTADPADE